MHVPHDLIHEYYLSNETNKSILRTYIYIYVYSVLQHVKKSIATASDPACMNGDAANTSLHLPSLPGRKPEGEITRKDSLASLSQSRPRLRRPSPS